MQANDDAATGQLTKSLELLSKKVGDPGMLVYAELFRRHPEHEERFFMDTDGSVRGEMLSQAFEVLMGTDENRASAKTIATANRFAHDGYDVSESEFNQFFCIIRDVTRDALESQWTAEFENRWADILNKVTGETTNP
jgi:hypothetical protein